MNQINSNDAVEVAVTVSRHLARIWGRDATEMIKNNWTVWQTVDTALDRPVLDALGRSVDDVIYDVVYQSVDSSVYRSVDDAVYWLVYGAVYQVVRSLR